MRRLGYGETPGHKGETSYARRLQATEFPRFHAYVNAIPDGIEINLHLDQKAPSYQGSKAHSGEYGGVTVENEIRRLGGLVAQMKMMVAVPTAPHPKKQNDDKPGFWGRLFG